MSESNLFLVPTDEPHPRRGVEDAVVRYLETHGIIEGFYDEASGWLAPGPRAGSLFAGNGEDEGFEYVIVYDSAAAHFVPDIHTGEFGASCRACGTSLDERLYDLLEAQGEGDTAQDMAGASVACPACAHENALVSLQSRVDTAVARFYVNVCSVTNHCVSERVISDLQDLIGSSLRVIYERA